MHTYTYIGAAGRRHHGWNGPPLAVTYTCQNNGLGSGGVNAGAQGGGGLGRRLD